MDVPQVDCELEQRVADSLVELAEPVERIDEHAGLGLEGQRHAGLLGVVSSRAYSLDEAVHSLFLGNGIGADPDQSETASAWRDSARSIARRRKSSRTASARGRGP